jgi:hypothetical protein
MLPREATELGILEADAGFRTRYSVLSFDGRVAPLNEPSREDKSTCSWSRFVRCSMRYRPSDFSGDRRNLSASVLKSGGSSESLLSEIEGMGGFVIMHGYRPLYMP